MKVFVEVVSAVAACELDGAVVVLTPALVSDAVPLTSAAVEAVGTAMLVLTLVEKRTEAVVTIADVEVLLPLGAVEDVVMAATLVDEELEPLSPPDTVKSMHDS